MRPRHEVQTVLAERTAARSLPRALHCPCVWLGGQIAHFEEGAENVVADLAGASWNRGHKGQSVALIRLPSNPLVEVPPVVTG
jgi:hypothetical protein